MVNATVIVRDGNDEILMAVPFLGFLCFVRSPPGRGQSWHRRAMAPAAYRTVGKKSYVASHSRSEPGTAKPCRGPRPQSSLENIGRVAADLKSPHDRVRRLRLYPEMSLASTGTQQ